MLAPSAPSPPPNTLGRILIVIVNWNTGRLLANCLKSLGSLPKEEQELIDEVIVVDNASTDNSVVAAEVASGKQGNRPRVRFVKSKTNLGFAMANNLAVEKVKEKSWDKILLLNPDTEVMPQSIMTLAEVLQQNEEIGIIGPRLLNFDGSLQRSVRSYPTFKILLMVMLKIHLLFKGASWWNEYMQTNFNYGKAQVADQVMGAAMMIKRQVWQQLAGLDERYWVWFEEVDFCKRAREKGWLTWYTPQAQIKHYGGASFHQLVGWRKTWPWIVSSIKYARKHWGIGAASLLLAVSPITLILSLPAMFLHIIKRKQLQR